MHPTPPQTPTHHTKKQQPSVFTAGNIAGTNWAGTILEARLQYAILKEDAADLEFCTRKAKEWIGTYILPDGQVRGPRVVWGMLTLCDVYIAGVIFYPAWALFPRSSNGLPVAAPTSRREPPRPTRPRTATSCTASLASPASWRWRPCCTTRPAGRSICLSTGGLYPMSTSGPDIRVYAREVCRG
jgi:hypothetical protein